MPDPSESFATPRIAAGALFVDELSRVFLVRPTYKQTWDLPGGYVEHGESPAAACKRELQEELGIARSPVRLIAVDWAPNGAEGDKILFVFDCGRLGDDEARIKLDAQELDQWKWVSLIDLDGYVLDRIARRIRSALAHGDVYLENGQIPGDASTAGPQTTPVS